MAKNDELDALLHLEEGFQAEGQLYAEEAGAAAGIREGRELGWKSGVALTSELEFYHGAAKALLSLCDSFNRVIPIKAMNAAEKLEAACRKISLAQIGNDETLDMDAHGGELRILFRQMIAYAGLGAIRFDLAGRSRLADFSF